jgi:hypothetical protein
MAAADARWQRIPKARRAQVYRAVGRAARDAREERDGKLAGDLRIVMDVLRAHAKAPATRRLARRTKTRPKRKPKR